MNKGPGSGEPSLIQGAVLLFFTRLIICPIAVKICH